MSRLVLFPNEALDAAVRRGPRPVSQHSLPSDPEAMKLAIGRAIEQVVIDSYKKHAMVHRTDAEDLRRATICTGWFNKLIGSPFRWTPDQALSAMRTVLDDTLSGRAPEPNPKQTMWVPDRTLIRGLA